MIDVLIHLIRRLQLTTSATVPKQESLLLALAGDGRELIAVGDPDQSIYGFRGADTRAVSRFTERFRAPDGSPAKVIALRTCRRSGQFLLSASRRIGVLVLIDQDHVVGLALPVSGRGAAEQPGRDPDDLRVVVGGA